MNHKVVIQIYQGCAEYMGTKFKIWKTLKNKNTNESTSMLFKSITINQAGGKKREKQVIFKGKSSLGR